jgi:hypothetical protein
MRGTELACSQVAFTCRSLLETLVTVAWDVLQLARVSVKGGGGEKKPPLPASLWSLLLELNTTFLVLLFLFLCSA